MSFAVNFGQFKEWKGRKWRNVWPSMVTHTWNLCSAFNPSKCTHTHTQQWVVKKHTHTTHTHTHTHTHRAVASQCSVAWGAFGGSVPCSTVSPQSWYWGWRERWTYTPPTYNPCWTWDSNPQPLGYKPNSLSIRARLPQLYSCSSRYPHWLILIYSYVVIYTIIHKKGTKLSLGWYLLNGIPMYLYL